MFTVGLYLPEVQRSVAYDDAEHYEVLLYHVPTGSAATVQVPSEHTQPAATRSASTDPAACGTHARGVRHGRPARTRYGLTITADHQHIWLDEPIHPVITLD